MRTLAITFLSSGILAIGASAPALADTYFGSPFKENYTGTAHSDVMFGGANDDRLRGVGGDDYLRGGADHDVLRGGTGWDELRDGAGVDLATGGPGNDDFYDGPGADTFEGGAGNDYFGMDGASAGDHINCGPGRDTVAYDVQTNPHDVLVNCERVWTFD